MSIDVEDDGCGFDPSMLNSDSSRSMTFGLDGMAERVRILNGHMNIDSAPGSGTRLNVRFPALGNPHRSLAGS